MTRACIDVTKAIELYRWLGSWPKVALAMPQPDGRCFKAQSICAAVWRHDKHQTPPILAYIDALIERERRGNGQT